MMSSGIASPILSMSSEIATYMLRISETVLDY
jgi:hypothetical protein